MRQFLLAGKVAYASATDDLTQVAEGAVGVFYNADGVLTVDSTGKNVKDEAMLVLGRKSENGGPVVLPIFKNNFSFVKGVYGEGASTFAAEVTIPEPTKIGDYSLIIVLKGTKFNERNKWTAMVHVKDVNIDGAALAAKLVEQINNNSGHGVTATVEGAKITLTANKAGVDYNVLGADELFGVEVTVTENGIPAYGDAAYVKDLAEKAAADAGFEYTYRDANYYMYPNFGVSPLAQPNAADAGYTIFTLRFAEPRDVKTRDEVVNQIVQVAFPTGAAAIATFETVCNGLAQ